MKIYLSCTSNLGDFLNSLPVLSGIYNSYGKIDFAIKRDMRKFNGIKELFDTSVEIYSHLHLYSSSSCLVY